MCVLFRDNKAKIGIGLDLVSRDLKKAPLGRNNQTTMNESYLSIYFSLYHFIPSPCTLTTMVRSFHLSSGVLCLVSSGSIRPMSSKVIRVSVVHFVSNAMVMCNNYSMGCLFGLGWLGLALVR
jgi:hypothetical protein